VSRRPKERGQSAIQVLKFGSSVLRDEDGLIDAVHEIYRHLRKGRRVVAVVSAIGDTTDRLLAAASRLSDRPDDEAIAALLATGESEAVALLYVALDRAGVSSYALDATTVGLKTRGARLDADPIAVDADGLRSRLEQRSVVVVPGFVGVHESGGLSLLGRGGSDLTALFLADALQCSCLLVKDVAGLYAADPAAPGPPPVRYESICFADAIALDGAILQHKAIRFAEERDQHFRVGRCADARQTRVGADRTAPAKDGDARAALRVGLLGLGTVGGGVAEALARRPERWTLVGAVVRNLSRPRPSSVPLHDCAQSLLDQGVDLLVHAAGKSESLEEALAEALRRGVDVITADKELVARRGVELEQLATASGARFLHGAAVGGAVPMIEVVTAHARDGECVSLEGVLNGTTNFLLDRQAKGESLDVALQAAQQLGFAEADPSADLDGSDAARKLIVLVRAAWNVELDLEAVLRTPLSDAPCPRDAVVDDCVVRVVARARRNADGTVEAIVEPRRLSAGHALAATRDEQNILLVRHENGEERWGGRGAGRWPTVEAILGDLHACARTRVRRTAEEAAA